MRNSSISAALVAALLLLAPSPARGQQSLQVPIQFDFLSPGARSLALGSAFVAMADDATAAWTNPAGLWYLTDSEVSMEGRFQQFEQSFMTGGRLSGELTRRLADVMVGPQFVPLEGDRTGLSFLSGLYYNRHVRLAAYRHELLRVDQSFTYDGVFQFEPNLQFDNRDIAFEGHRKIVIDNYGVSAGRRLGPSSNRWWGGILVGAGVSMARFSLNYTASTFLHQTLYGAPDPSQWLQRSAQTGDEWAVAATAGVLAPVHSRVTLGAAYRHGPTFNFTTVLTPRTSAQVSAEEQFDVPDVVAVGLRLGAFTRGASSSAGVQPATVSEPSGTWGLLVEYKRVQNSQLRSSYVASFLRANDPLEKAYAFSIDDSNEIHLGAEYQFSRRRGKPTLRGGVWYDPDHSIQYSSPTNDLYDERFRTSLSTGKDLWHYTFGLGLSRKGILDFNFGGDATSRSLVISASAIVRFRKSSQPVLPPLDLPETIDPAPPVER
jgi:hypothetical protein